MLNQNTNLQKGGVYLSYGETLCSRIRFVTVVTTTCRPHLSEEVADSSQTVGDAWFGLAQPVVVGDADIVHIFQKGVLTRKNQLIQALRSRFLHPLKAEFDVDRKLLQHED